MKKLTVLENSLQKKKKQFDDKLQNHINTVKQANGQPLNDKRNGQATLNKWAKQNDILRDLKESIEKTERAIQIEKNKIVGCELVKNDLPAPILKMLENGRLIQWRKYPNTFFVKNVDKARIVWDKKKKVIAHKYSKQIIDKNQRSVFAKTYNELFKCVGGNFKN